MKSAHTPKSASALDQRRNSTASAPRPDISKAVADIRAACANIAHLAALDTLSKRVKQ